MQYVIIGGSIAATGAIEGIRQVDSDGSITVVSGETPAFYSRPLISYYLAGKIGMDQLSFRPDSLYQGHGVKVVYGSAAGVDPSGRVIMEDGRVIEWDRLLLAVGGSPVLLDKLAKKRTNVVGFYTLEDVHRIKKLARSGMRAVIIGAGLVGLKAAEALHSLGVSSTVVDLAEGVLPATLDLPASYIVQEQLEKNGVDFRLGVAVTGLEGSLQVDMVSLNSGERLPCDLVVVAAGVQPNLVLARQAGIETDIGILVDRHQQTNCASIYAAGDVCQGRDLLSFEKRVVPLLPVALEQGITAGLNMAGSSREYRGSLALNSTTLMGVTIMSAGKSKDDGLRAFWKHPSAYRKVVMEDGRLTGMIAVNNNDKMGILTRLIREGTLADGCESELLRERLEVIELETLLARGEGNVHN